MPTSTDTEWRHLGLNIAEGVLFLSSAGFVSAQTVIPALVSRLGGNNVAIGAVSAISWVVVFLPQIFSASAMLCGSIWALLAPAVGWFRFVYLFVGIQVGTEMMARYTMATLYAPVSQRSTYVGMMNTMLAPFYLSNLLGGWLSDTLGYRALFITGAALSAVAIGMMVYLVHEARMTSHARGPDMPVAGK